MGALRVVAPGERFLDRHHKVESLLLEHDGLYLGMRPDAHECDLKMNTTGRPSSAHILGRASHFVYHAMPGNGNSVAQAAPGEGLIHFSD